MKRARVTLSGTLRALAAAAVIVAGAGVAAGGCARGCRAISTTPIAVECAPTAGFLGELHFDDAATWETFLETSCIPDAEETEIAGLVESVDFTVDAVFIATGDRAAAGRCIGTREADGVEVCDDGLRVGFADALTDDAACAGRWTVAFSLPRAELRAALDTNTGGAIE